MPVINNTAASKTSASLGLPLKASANGETHETTLLIDALLHGAPKSISTTAAPLGPSIGDSYIVPAGGTGAFAGQAGNIAVCNPDSVKDGIPSRYRWEWDFISPKVGMVLYVQDVAKFYTYTASGWIPSPVAFAGAAPANSSSAGIQGQIFADASAIFVCTATNTWRKVATTTF